MPKRIYPLELHTFITEHAAGTTNKKLADLINARFGDGYMTESQVKAYRKNHHLPSGLPKGRATYFSRIFPEPVVRYIMDNYVGTGPTEMAGKLNAAFETNYTVAQINGYYSNHHLNCALPAVLKKDTSPPTKVSIRRRSAVWQKPNLGKAICHTILSLSVMSESVKMVMLR